MAIETQLRVAVEESVTERATLAVSGLPTHQPTPQLALALSDPAASTPNARRATVGTFVKPLHSGRS